MKKEQVFKRALIIVPVCMGGLLAVIFLFPIITLMVMCGIAVLFAIIAMCHGIADVLGD